MVDVPRVQSTAAYLVLVLGLATPGLAQAAEIFLTNGTSWTVPNDWNSANNTIEVIGGGGGGDNNSTGSGTGGGGGAYSKITNLSLTPGSTLAYQVGAGGAGGLTTSGANGGDTWFNGAGCAAASACAKGGGGGIYHGGLGGASSGGVGAITFSGGNAGYSPNKGGGGGGGAAGLNGNGANGGYGAPAGGSNDTGGGGGGGADNGTAGASADGNANQGAAGTGGNDGGAAGGGLAGAPNGGTGGNGTNGGGGGGGGGGVNIADGNGGAGSTGTEWDAFRGSGGGGGGGGGDLSTGRSGSGGAGGLYGGGGAGPGETGGGTDQAGGNGAQGVIVISYMPTTMIRPSLIAIPSGATWGNSGSLGYLASQLGFYFGTEMCLCDVNNDPDPQYPPIDISNIRYHFSSLVPGVELSWPVIHPNPPGSAGEYSFGQSDAMVAFAQQNHQTVRGGGHLVWDHANPSWLDAYAGNGPALQQIMVDHIDTVMGRYAQNYPGVVTSWNVVNEPFRVDGSGNITLSQSIWSAIGSSPSDYITLAFQTAHSIDASAKLCLNDFPDGDTTLYDGFSYNGTTYDGMTHWDLDFLLVQSLKAQGVPIDCFGVQMHTGVFNYPPQPQNFITDLPPSESIAFQLQRFANIGVEVRVSEADFGFDVQHLAFGTYDDAHYAIANQQWQAEIQACIDAPNCTEFNLWSYADRYSDYVYGVQNPPLTPYNAADMQLNATLVYDTLSWTLMNNQPSP